MFSTDPDRKLSETEVTLVDALREAGWKVSRCMAAWNAFDKDGRTITVWWDEAGEIEHVEGLTAAELIRLLA